MVLLSSAPFSIARALPVSTTSVQPTTSIPDNCHTIIVLNTSATAALVGLATPGTVLAAGVSAMTVPAGASLTLAIGTITTRGIMDNVRVVGSGLVYASTAAVAVTLEITYLSAFGPT